MRRLESHPALEVVQHLPRRRGSRIGQGAVLGGCDHVARAGEKDRKSTRLNSSHDQISYAVFCLKKKKHNIQPERNQRCTIQVDAEITLAEGGGIIRLATLQRHTPTPDTPEKHTHSIAMIINGH